MSRLEFAPTFSGWTGVNLPEAAPAVAITTAETTHNFEVPVLKTGTEKRDFAGENIYKKSRWLKNNLELANNIEQETPESVAQELLNTAAADRRILTSAKFYIDNGAEIEATRFTTCGKDVNAAFDQINGNDTAAQESLTFLTNFINGSKLSLRKHTGKYQTLFDGRHMNAAICQRDEQMVEKDVLVVEKDGKEFIFKVECGFQPVDTEEFPNVPVTTTVPEAPVTTTTAPARTTTTVTVTSAPPTLPPISIPGITTTTVAPTTTRQETTTSAPTTTRQETTTTSTTSTTIPRQETTTTSSTSTTKPKETTTTTRQTTTTTSISTTTTVPEVKVDDSRLPGETIPAAQQPGTPDVPGPSTNGVPGAPGAGNANVDPSGYAPGETRPTNPTPTATTAAPTTTKPASSNGDPAPSTTVLETQPVSNVTAVPTTAPMPTTTRPVNTMVPTEMGFAYSGGVPESFRDGAILVVPVLLLAGIAKKFRRNRITGLTR